ncbi:MAG: ribbon-helix-helix domain-containing protein [Ilumatobacteraceae bacterium]
MSNRKRTFHTNTGEVLTDADLHRLADEYATKEFDLSTFIRLPGRPMMGKSVANVVPVRLEDEVVESLDSRARRDDTTRSDVIRRAIAAYLAS